MGRHYMPGNDSEKKVSFKFLFIMTYYTNTAHEQWLTLEIRSRIEYIPSGNIIVHNQWRIQGEDGGMHPPTGGPAYRDFLSVMYESQT